MFSSTPQAKSVLNQGKFTKITPGIESIRELQRYAVHKNGRAAGAEKFGLHRRLPETTQPAADEASLAQNTARPNAGARK
jgi:hypothetical protein